MVIYHGKNGEIEVTGTPNIGIVGCADSFSFDIATNREGKYEIGSNKVTHFKTGNIEITGTLDKYWIDNTWADTLLMGTPPLCQITAKVEKDGNSATAVLEDVTFTDRSSEIPAEDLVTESLDFQAKNVTFK